MKTLTALACVAGILIPSTLVTRADNSAPTGVSDVPVGADTPATSAGAPFQIPEEFRNNPPSWLRAYLTGLQPAPYIVPKKPGLYTLTDWTAAINATWGTGLPGATKSSLFIQWWSAVNGYAATFHNIDTTVWSDAYTEYSPATVNYDTVSRGRFAAIMSNMSLRVQDIHVDSRDLVVAYTYPSPGVPLLYPGATGDNTHFGAALTPLPDSTLLVYQAVSPHPLGLVPGDLVLGYDGVPWKDLYPQLLAGELPIGLTSGMLWGGNDLSFTHDMLMSAGMNWHLFDTIDVVKYDTGDTLHLSTAPLSSQPYYIWATEQLPIPGIAHTGWSDPPVQWAMIPGTRIGYIYFMWLPDGSSKFLFNSALINLIDSENVKGLIIDFRTDYGGASSGYPNFSRLFDSTVQPMNWYYRCGTCCKRLMCAASGFDTPFTIFGDSTSPLHYDRPIAVLTGPNAVSMGDQMPHALSLRPKTRIFGKPTGGHFNGYSTSAPFSNPFVTQADWYFFLPTVCSAQGLDNSKFMIHSVFPNPVDYPEADYQPVWLTRDGVANGIDDVVEAAKAWIVSLDTDQDGVANEVDNCPNRYNPAQEDEDSNGVGDSCECNVIVVDNTGDVNHSGAITSADIIALVNYVFKSGSSPLPCAAVGDVNCTGDISSADIIALVNYVFKSQAPPCDVCTLIATSVWTCP